MKDRIGTIREAVTRMTGLIESTLDSARMAAGKIEKTLGPVDLAALLEDVLARQRHVTPARRVALDLADVPPGLTADRELLDQVFTNLLSNAVKYSPKDSPIEITGRREDGEVIIAFRDHGAGIAPEEVPRLGERYFRAGTSTGVPGTGLGLHPTQRLVEMHGGTLEAGSTLDEGLILSVRLPISRSATAVPRGFRQAWTAIWSAARVEDEDDTSQGVHGHG